MGIETIVALAGAAIGVGSTVYSIATAPGKPDAPAPPKDPNKLAMQAAYASAESMKKRQGLMSTMVTGSGGVAGQPTTMKTLLGE